MQSAPWGPPSTQIQPSCPPAVLLQPAASPLGARQPPSTVPALPVQTPGRLLQPGSMASILPGSQEEEEQLQQQASAPESAPPLAAAAAARRRRHQRRWDPLLACRLSQATAPRSLTLPPPTPPDQQEESEGLSFVDLMVQTFQKDVAAMFQVSKQVGRQRCAAREAPCWLQLALHDLAAHFELSVQQLGTCCFGSQSGWVVRSFSDRQVQASTQQPPTLLAPPTCRRS